MSLRIFLEYSFPWTPLSWVFLALYTKAPFSLCSIDIGFPDTTFHRVMLVARVSFFLTVFCTGYFFPSVLFPFFLLFNFLFLTKVHYVAQNSLKLFIFQSLPFLGVGISGICCHAQPSFLLYQVSTHQSTPKPMSFILYF